MKPQFKSILAYICFVLMPGIVVHSQSFSFNCSRDTLIARCSPTPCFTLTAKIPDIRATTGSYTVNPIGATPSACFPVYVQPNDPGGTLADVTLDDIYSDLINIGFPFPFYGITYNSLVVSPNGMLSFTASLANQIAHYGILWDVNILSATAGVPLDLPSALYDPAIIMGPYHDLNPVMPTSPDRRVQYQVIGTAPHRKWVLSYYLMPLYSISSGCNLLIQNTHQIVLYESTGIVEVLIFDKQPCVGWNDGRSMIGIQDASKTQALMVQDRKASDPPWGSPGMMEAYRFVPASGASLLKRVELCDLAGTVLTTGTTTNLGNGLLEASFPNLCPAIGSTVTYVVRSVYSKIDNPLVEIFGTDTVTVTKSASTDLNATFVTTNTSCFAPTGTITVTVPPGTASPPYNYILDGGTPIVANSPYTFTNVGPGPHTITIEDQSAVCSDIINVTVVRDNQLTANVTTTPASCPTVFNGSITINPTNGTGPYTYTLDGGLPQPGGDPHTITNMNFGAHTIVVTDATGCLTNVINVDVPLGPGVNGNTSSTPVSCASATNGTVTATPTAGVAPFQFQLDGGAIQTGTSPYTFVNVSAGLHNVTFIDNLGCSRVVSVNVGVGPGVTATTSFTGATCPGVDNGSITATALTGVAPFTFQLDGGPILPFANPHTFTNVSGGAHIVTIRDNVGCTTPFNVNVTSGPPLNANANSTGTSCNGASNGTITVVPTNGTGPYTFSLDGGPLVPGTIPFTFNNVSSGAHTVTVRDVFGCLTNAIPVNVVAGPTITTTVNRTNALCNGSATGTITIVQPTLGNPPFQYSLDGIVWQFSNTFTGLLAGNYTAWFRSSNGCVGSTTTTITEPTAVTATVSTIPVVCNGQSNGTIQVSPFGGVGVYSYSIDGGLNWQASPVFNMPAGNYIITIRDGNNCTITRPVTVTQPAVLTAASLNQNASCDGGNDGRIVVNASGGNTSYSYSIDGVNYQASNLFLVPPGNYTIHVKDNLGCSTSFPTTVGLTVNLTLTPQADITICKGLSGQLQAVSNATIYSWSPVTALSDPNIANPIASPTATTQYIVAANLGRCTTYDTIIVNVNESPIPNAGPDGDICYGQSFTLQGSGGTFYEWTPALYLSSTTAMNPVATPTRTTTYTLTVVDANGCRSLVTDEVKVIVSRPMRIHTSPYDTVVYPGAQIQLLATSEGINYTWSPTIGLSNPNISDPILTAGGIGNDITYEVVATTQEGCKGEGYVRIKIYNGPEIYVPTGFTPNNDGKNDKLTPFPVGIKKLNYFKVFNRWGEMIFSTTRHNDGWDGKIRGKEQPAGIYIWIVEGVTQDNKVITKKGTVTLIR